jgi:hypothetical protein
MNQNFPICLEGGLSAMFSWEEEMETSYPIISPNTAQLQLFVLLHPLSQYPEASPSQENVAKSYLFNVPK